MIRAAGLADTDFNRKNGGSIILYLNILAPLICASLIKQVREASQQYKPACRAGTLNFVLVALERAEAQSR